MWVPGLGLEGAALMEWASVLLTIVVPSPTPSFKGKPAGESADWQEAASERDSQVWLVSETRHRTKWSIVGLRSSSSHLTCKCQVIGLVMGSGDFHLEVTASLPAWGTAATESHCSQGKLPRSLRNIWIWVSMWGCAQFQGESFACLFLPYSYLRSPRSKYKVLAEGLCRDIEEDRRPGRT